MKHILRKRIPLNIAGPSASKSNIVPAAVGGTLGVLIIIVIIIIVIVFMYYRQNKKKGGEKYHYNVNKSKIVIPFPNDCSLISQGKENIIQQDLIYLI